MQIEPNSEVRLLKGVPFSIDYKDVILFANHNSQAEYFLGLTKFTESKVTYIRENGTIKVKHPKDALIDINYIMYKNSNFSDKWFYAFVTGISYVNPNTTLISFKLDYWNTYMFDVTIGKSFVEREHCQRWNSDGTPVINTVPEDIDYGSELIVKDHQQYNNNLYWVCFVTSCSEDDVPGINNFASGVPSILKQFYLPIYFDGTNEWIPSFYNDNQIVTPQIIFDLFRNATNLSHALVSAFLIEDPPFNYTYEITTQKGQKVITVDSNEIVIGSLHGSLETITKFYPVIGCKASKVARHKRHFPKYGNLANGITESKLLMYPYSYVQLIDGGGNTFNIKNEYNNNIDITIETFTSAGLNSKQAHIVQNYLHPNVTLNDCRWELGNGIINSYHNNLTIIDDYASAYLQGNANTMDQTISNIMAQTNLNNQLAQQKSGLNVDTTRAQNIGNMLNGIISGAIGGAGAGGVGIGTGAVTGFAQAGIGAIVNSTTTELANQYLVESTEMQGNLNNEKATKMAMAKLQDAKNVADNVSLQGGDVFFTFQNKFDGYCLVYKQITPEYVNILQGYFQKYGYKVNTFKTPNLHTRQSWNYIRTVDAYVTGNCPQAVIEAFKTMLDNGLTVWHTTDVGNYNLSNNEI